MTEKTPPITPKDLADVQPARRISRRPDTKATRSVTFGASVGNGSAPSDDAAEAAAGAGCSCGSGSGSGCAGDTAKAADAALTRLEVDGRGLDAMDRRYLACIAENYGGGPVGVDTLAAALSEQRDVIEDVIEPYLMQLGLLMRTPRGRLLSEGGYRHLGKTIPKGQKQQLDLLAGGQEDNQPDDQAGEA